MYMLEEMVMIYHLKHCIMLRRLPVRFLFYFILSKSHSTIKREDHDKHLLLELGWILDRDIKDPKYPEDINFIKSWLNQINQLKREIATMQREDNLRVNESKTDT